MRVNLLTRLVLNVIRLVLGGFRPATDVRYISLQAADQTSANTSSGAAGSPTTRSRERRSLACRTLGYG